MAFETAVVGAYQVGGGLGLISDEVQDVLIAVAMAFAETEFDQRGVDVTLVLAAEQQGVAQHRLCGPGLPGRRTPAPRPLRGAASTIKNVSASADRSA